MNRLTNLGGDGFIVCNGCFEPQCTNCKEFKNQASRLSEYEDTGLEPHEILTGLELANIYAALQRLKQYEQLKAELSDLQSHEKKTIEKAKLWGKGLIEANSDAHVSICTECGFPIADYGVDVEIWCSWCETKNKSNNYVPAGPGYCKTKHTRKAKTFDKLFHGGIKKRKEEQNA